MLKHFLACAFLFVMGVSAYSMNPINSPPIQSDNDVIVGGITDQQSTSSQADMFIQVIERNKDPVTNYSEFVYKDTGEKILPTAQHDIAVLVYHESANRIRDQEYVYLKEVSQSGKALEKQQNGQSFLKVLLI